MLRAPEPYGVPRFHGRAQHDEPEVKCLSSHRDSVKGLCKGYAVYTTPVSNTGPKTIAGVLERITFQNEETGYTIARFLP